MRDKFRRCLHHLGTPNTIGRSEKKKNFIKFENLNLKLFYNDHVCLKLMNMVHDSLFDVTKEYNKVYSVNFLEMLLKVIQLNIKMLKLMIKSYNSSKMTIQFGLDVTRIFSREN